MSNNTGLIDKLGAELRNSKMSVPDYLNAVDYEVLRGLVPSEFAIQYINFIKLASSNLDLDLSPPVHYKMVDGLISKKRMLANLCHRGLGKTFVMSVNLALYLAVFQYLPNFGSVNTMIFIGDTMENGAKNMRKGIESLYNSSPFLQQYLPKAKFTDNYIEFTNAEGNLFGLKLYGASTGVRGVNIFNKRPEICIFDDILKDGDSESPTILAAIKDTIYKGVMPALHPTRRKIIYNGTPFNKNDPLYEIVESGSWEVNVYPVCNSFPCTREEFKGSWGDRFTYDFVKEQYDLAVASGQVKAFNQEYMLRIASEEDRVIQDSDIRWFNIIDLMRNKQRYNFYVTSDFATSTNRKADYTVIGVWAVDKYKNRFLVDGVIGRQLMNQTFDDIFSLVSKYNPMSVGLEVTGQQGAFISLFREEMLKRNIWFNIASSKGSNKEGISVKNNKMERFRLTIPKFKAGKVYLPNELKESMLVAEILGELSFATIDGIKSKHDDAIDMISQLDQMYLVYPDVTQANLKSNESKVNTVDPFFTDSVNQENEIYYDSYLA